METNSQTPPPLLTPRDLGRLFLFTVLAILVAQMLSLLLPMPYALALQELCIIVPAILYVVKRKLPLVRTFRLGLPTPAIFFFSLLATIGVVVLADELDRLINHFFPMPEELAKGLEQLMRADSVQEMLLIIGGAVIVAAVAEEMLFRGMILTALEQFKDAASAIVLSAIFFALIHFNPWGAVQIALLGFALGYLAWKSQSIWPGVILHALNNLLAFLWLNLPKEFWNWYCGEIHVHSYWLIAAGLLVWFGVDRFNRACDAREINEGSVIGD